MKNHSTISGSKHGFSLLEMLTTIAILGIMTGIALPWFGGNAQQLNQARDQRNAQNLCSLCQAAEAAGLNLVEEGSDKIEVIKSLIEGVTVESGVLSGRTFALPNLGNEEVLGAAQFLHIRDGSLVYDVTMTAKAGGTRESETI